MSRLYPETLKIYLFFVVPRVISHINFQTEEKKKKYKFKATVYNIRELLSSLFNSEPVGN